MAVLDIILVKNLIDAPTTVNTNFSTNSIDISNRQDAFSVQLIYNNGVAVDMDIFLEVSNDNVNFSPVASQNITDSSGGHIFDVDDTGTGYMRISITVNAGSMDVQSIVYKGKRLH